MFTSALEEAFALSVLTRKRLRSVPVEDPVAALDRIQEFVRTNSYARSYSYLKSPVNASAPILQKWKDPSGVEMIIGSIILAPIWVLAAPLFIAGVASTMAPPPSDERANQHNRARLLSHLADLQRRVKSELANDTSQARRLGSYLKSHGVASLDEVHSQTVFKEWTSYYSATAGVAKRRRNGWHVEEMGELHVGEFKAAFFGNKGDVIDLRRGTIETVSVAHRCVLIVTYRKPKRQIALFLPQSAFQTAAHVKAANARVNAPTEARSIASSIGSAARKMADKARTLTPAPLRRSRQGKTSENSED